MTLFITKHTLSGVRTGATAAMADGAAVDGQRLATGTNSQVFTGPAEFRLTTDADTFVSIAALAADLDTASAKALRIGAGGVEWVRLDNGNWQFKAS